MFFGLLVCVNERLCMGHTYTYMHITIRVPVSVCVCLFAVWCISK